MKDLKIDVFLGYGYDCNIYLIEGEVLVDSGTGHTHNVFIDWLKERTEVRDIHTLLLTHRHYDHSGGAADILRETGATAYIHEADAPPVMNGDVVTTGARTFRGDQIPIDVVQINEDHVIDINGHLFRVLYTPGHTVGSISLYNEDSQILFPGDTIFANGGVGRWDLTTGDHGALKKSISTLAGLAIRDLYPGHDVVVKGDGKRHALLALESINHNPFELLMRRQNLLQND